MTELLDLYSRVGNTTPAANEPLPAVNNHATPTPLRDATCNPTMAAAFHHGLIEAGWTTKRFGDGFQYRHGKGPWMDLQSAAIRATSRL